MIEIHQQLIQDIQTNKFDKLDLLHHLSSGFKAVYSKITYEGVDILRQACGGAGFSCWSGLPTILVDFAPNTTFEGDNTVMLQQCAKGIMKNAKQFAKGKKTSGIFEYFNDFDQLLGLKSGVKKFEDLLCLNRLENALATRAASKIRSTMMNLFQSKHSNNENINTHFAVDIVAMAQSHVVYVTFKYCLEMIERSFKCEANKENMKNLLRVFALTELQQDSAVLYESGFFQMGTGNLILEALKHLMIILRPQMIPLVEAWGFPDGILVSAIGNSYGDIYE